MRIKDCFKKKGLKASEIRALIDENILSERDRRLLKRILLDGITYQKASEEVNLSVRYTIKIVHKNVKILLDILDENETDHKNGT